MNWLLNCLYAVAGVLLLPVWLWKLPRAKRYRAGIWQRLGFAPRLPEDQPRLWIHCASVGEASVPRRLVSELRRRRPGWDIAFSTNTNTGARRLRELYPDAPVFYMPLDFSFCVHRALRRVKPDAVLLVELELWPNFALSCRSVGVPVGIVNGRIGPGSRRFLGILRRFLPHIWDPVRVCCARGRTDALAFRGAGMPEERLFVCGSLKYDALKIEPSPEKQRRLAELFNIEPVAPVLVAGSTHQGEEAVLGVVYRDLRIRHRRLRLIIAPRHVERAAQVATTLRSRNLPVARKTRLEESGPTDGEPVILVDTIGDLVDCYGLATCVFVGRSLLPPGGGQNVMEPAALGKPVLVGPHTGNFQTEVRLLVERGAATVVRDRRELTAEVQRLLREPEEAGRMGRAGRAVIRESQGATERTLTHLRPLLEAVQPTQPAP